MATSNNKLSTIVETGIPYFIRDDHPQFVLFLKKYYEFLEQQESFTGGYPVERIINHLNNIDIDTTQHDEAAEYLYNKFIQDIPKTIEADKAILLKNIKDFYRSKGTEKATKFLIYLLTGFENAQIYYPKTNILKTSDGKWYVEKTLRISNTTIDGVVNTSLYGLNSLIGQRIIGNTSNASAVVENYNRFYEQGTLIDELILSNINGSFENAELLNFSSGSTAELYSGIVNSVEIVSPGLGYNIGDPVIVVSNTGAGACVVVSAVSTGNLSSISVLNAGAGFRAGDPLLILGGGGTDANAIVASVDTSGNVHPNSYNIVYATVGLEANTPIGNAVYSNLNSSVSDPANNWIGNSMLYFAYSNVGPVESVEMVAYGFGYTSTPTIDIIANTVVKNIGILGRMRIAAGGLNYQVGDAIGFVGGYGCGAAANVTQVAANGMIEQVRFKEVTGFPVGGLGYTQDNLPSTVITSANGSGANVIVTAILGDGEAFGVSGNTSIGAIERVTIINRGSGYDSNSYIDMTSRGDGSANLVASFITGVYSYPGRYLNSDGFLSSINYLQGRDYYQPFSYVIQSGVSIEKYRNTYVKLNHPSGFKLFGEFQLKDNTDSKSYSTELLETTKLIFLRKSYTKTSNTINIAYSSHGLSNGSNVYLEFVSGSNVYNDLYSVTTIHSDYILTTGNNSSNTSGTVDVGF